LVDDRPNQHSRAIFLTLYGQAAKPLRPTVVEVPFHVKSIVVGHCILELVKSVSVESQSTDEGCPSNRPKGVSGGV